MQLHRIEGSSDWADVPKSKRNGWQKVAAATVGIVTPGNVISLVGLASVPWAVFLIGRNRPILAAVVLALGRGCDLLDGYAADKTGTKSRLGEAVDATFDKLSGVYILVGLGVEQTVPWFVLVSIMVPHILISIVALFAFFKSERLHPSPVGKISMAVAWVGLLGFIVAAGTSGLLHNILLGLSYGLTGASIALALVAFGGYVKDVSRQLQSK